MQPSACLANRYFQRFLPIILARFNRYLQLFKSIFPSHNCCLHPFFSHVNRCIYHFFPIFPVRFDVACNYFPPSLDRCWKKIFTSHKVACNPLYPSVCLDNRYFQRFLPIILARFNRHLQLFFCSHNRFLQRVVEVCRWRTVSAVMTHTVSLVAQPQRGGNIV